MEAGADIPMIVIVAGSRTITDYPIVKATIEASGFNITELVSGHAPPSEKSNWLPSAYVSENCPDGGGLVAGQRCPKATNTFSTAKAYNQKMGTISYNPTEAEICERRGHDPNYGTKYWKQCRFCGTWRRSIVTEEVRTEAPPAEELDPCDVLIAQMCERAGLVAKP